MHAPPEPEYELVYWITCGVQFQIFTRVCDCVSSTFMTRRFCQVTVYGDAAGESWLFKSNFFTLIFRIEGPFVFNSRINDMFPFLLLFIVPDVKLNSPISPSGLTLPRWRSPWEGTRPTSRPRHASQPACPRRAQPAAYTAICLESSAWAPTPLPWRTVWCQDGEETRRDFAKPP